MRGLERLGISSWASGMAWTALVGSLVPALTGCNSLTGVGDLNVAQSGSAGGEGGSGGAWNGNGNGNASSSSGPQPKLCTYPTGQWDHKVGGTVAQTLNWQGMVENSDAMTTIKAEDYLDCDGSKGINALLIDTSATWCGACQQEAQEIPGKVSTTWAAMGIKVLTLMYEDVTQSKPATFQTAVNWKNQFKLNSIAVGVDPALSFSPAGASSIGLPLQVIVDPRTMQVIDMQEGYSGDYTKLEALAQMNKLE